MYGRVSSLKDTKLFTRMFFKNNFIECARNCVYLITCIILPKSYEVGYYHYIHFIKEKLSGEKTWFIHGHSVAKSYIHDEIRSLTSYNIKISSIIYSRDDSACRYLIRIKAYDKKKLLQMLSSEKPLVLKILTLIALCRLHNNNLKSRENARTSLQSKIY